MEHSQLRYQALVPKSSALLLGPTDALLRSEFRALRAKGVSVRRPPIRKIVVSFGGVDLPNATALCLKSLQNLKEAKVSIDVIIGAGKRAPGGS